ncbi:hypothetical protein BGW42_005716 [Actinomortierella wolfii]|nr:hypothetical protein BGW42_005716 [Actinomortierella wolfii]
MARHLTVIIVGAGIGGIVLGIMLSKANINFVILEKATAFRHLGSAMILTPQTLRVMEQMGIDLTKVGNQVVGATYYNQNLTRVGSVVSSDYVERYGYPALFFARPELIEELLRHVPRERILLGKKVLSTMQNKEGVMVRTSDGERYHGDILVGADGAYSAVRQSMHKNMLLKGLAVPKSDLEPLRFDQFAIVGTTKPREGGWPDLEGRVNYMNLILGGREPYNMYLIPLTNGRIGWLIGGKMLSTLLQGQENFRFSDWSHEPLDDILPMIRDLPTPIGGTLGTLIDASEVCSRVLLEDRMFKLWFDGRTVLIGDACHKLIPSGGQGANQCILDCICLANLLVEMPSTSPEDIKNAFEKYYEIRSQSAAMAVANSQNMNKLLGSQTWLMQQVRKMVLNMPMWMMHKVYDGVYSARPILTYLPDIPLKGSVPDSSKKMTATATAI